MLTPRPSEIVRAYEQEVDQDADRGLPWHTRAPGPWAHVQYETNEDLVLWWMEVVGTFEPPRHIRHYQQWLYVERWTDDLGAPNRKREVDVYSMVSLARRYGEIWTTIPFAEARFEAAHCVLPEWENAQW